MNAKQLAELLELKEHPEGGFYKETYRSETLLPKEAIASRFSGSRNMSTAIYFLVEAGNFSAFHKIKSDEMWHFYLGDTLEIFEINENGNLICTLLGKDVWNGEVLQHLVKANTWFGSRVKSGGTFSLTGCTVAPGFDFTDFEMAERLGLSTKFPQHQKLIEEMTRI